MREVRKLIGLVAGDGRTGVLIRGETGTGKELVARAVHRRGVRRDGSYVVVPLPSLNSDTVASDLFGHERGAFTGAEKQRTGFIKEADGGVIFLDEIGDLVPDVQVKMLRVLDGREFTRLGGNRNIRVDVQWVMATHRDLAEMVGKGVFRKDLYFRIKTFEIILPPLRERGGDIRLLADHFLEMLREEHWYPLKGFEPGVYDVFRKYPWPGNVRELKQVIESAIMRAKHEEERTVRERHLPADIFTGERKPVAGDGPVPADLEKSVAEYELSFISRAVETGRKKAELAEMLGYRDRFALRRKVLSLFRKYPGMEEMFPRVARAFLRAGREKCP